MVDKASFATCSDWWAVVPSLGWPEVWPEVEWETAEPLHIGWGKVFGPPLALWCHRGGNSGAGSRPDALSSTLGWCTGTSTMVASAERLVVCGHLSHDLASLQGLGETDLASLPSELQVTPLCPRRLAASYWGHQGHTYRDASKLAGDAGTLVGGAGAVSGDAGTVAGDAWAGARGIRGSGSGSGRDHRNLAGVETELAGVLICDLGQDNWRRLERVRCLALRSLCQLCPNEVTYGYIDRCAWPRDSRSHGFPHIHP